MIIVNFLCITIIVIIIMKTLSKTAVMHSQSVPQFNDQLLIIATMMTVAIILILILILILIILIILMI